MYRLLCHVDHVAVLHFLMQRAVPSGMAQTTLSCHLAGITQSLTPFGLEEALCISRHLMSYSQKTRKQESTISMERKHYYAAIYHRLSFTEPLESRPCSHRYCAQACYRAKLFQWTSIEKCYYLEARRIAPDD